MREADPALVERSKSGDPEAFRELVTRHARGVFLLAYRITRRQEDADDVVQETFLKAHRALASFDDRASFPTWLHRIAGNTALDLLRRKQVRFTLPLSAEVDDRPALEPASQGPSPEGEARGREIGRRLEAALSGLSASERSAVVLRHFEGLGLDEIGLALGVSPLAAKSCVFRATDKLRRALGDLL
ncbi:MAG: sigma-70 family RNA polymerase sigma factor [Acidobacteria bacterium]|nr:sigma-70 family RNA polymerase sigma factor [Acidobacteriota bacterium]